MLIELTYKCNGNCTHCFNSCTMEDDYMNYATFQKLKQFIKLLSPNIFLISGGEFTLIPDFDTKIQELIQIDSRNVFSLLSNGSFIFDDDKTSKIVKLLEYPNVIGLQVTTHQKYYPSYETIMNQKQRIESLGKKVMFKHDWQGEGEGNGMSNLINLGRARDLQFEIKGQPSCGSLLAIARQLDKIPSLVTHDFLKLIYTLMGNQKLCTPAITPDGDLTIGESRFCQKFGNINDLRDPVEFMDGLVEKLNELKFCNKCGARKNIPEWKLQVLDL